MITCAFIIHEMVSIIRDTNKYPKWWEIISKAASLDFYTVAHVRQLVVTFLHLSQLMMSSTFSAPL